MGSVGRVVVKRKDVAIHQFTRHVSDLPFRWKFQICSSLNTRFWDRVNDPRVDLKTDKRNVFEYPVSYLLQEILKHKLLYLIHEWNKMSVILTYLYVGILLWFLRSCVYA